MRQLKLFLLTILIICGFHTIGYTMEERDISGIPHQLVQTDYPVVVGIMCGGSGSRLWPVSREDDPKFFIELPDGQSLLQKTYLRGAAIPDASHVITIANKAYDFRVRDEYAKVDSFINKPIQNHNIFEPCGRNTAAAIAAACLYASENISPDTILLILSADHLIADQQAFVNAVAQAVELAKNNRIVTFGITPTYPETGYGYIEYDDTDVRRFVEKPNREIAESYIESGRFAWNSGMFCFKAQTMITEMMTYCPDILLSTKTAFDGAARKPNEIYLKLEDFSLVHSDSIDYAIMENTKDASVVPCNIGWSDIGDWKSLGDLTLTDETGNRTVGDVITKNCTNCTVWAKDRVIAAVGLTDIIIIDTGDALLVTDRESTQDVKVIYKQLQERGHEVYKTPPTVKRPWGTYTVLNEGVGFKVKRIEVEPGKRLSLQSHEHRSENWVIAIGTAKVINGEQELILTTGGSTFIPAGNKHRLENIGEYMLTLIETQTGNYLGEDDIIRYDDDHGRV